MDKIAEIIGYELMDSRGNPTVGAKVITKNGYEGFAIAPSGASTGIYEAHELRDNDEKRYLGKGVTKAVENINTVILNTLIGTDISNQREIDRKMIEADLTENKKNLGANAILAVSLACAKAAAASYNMPLYKYLGGINSYVLPRPMMNILNGGAHAANNIDIQEFMIIPMYCKSFCEGLRQCSEIYHCLGKILKKEGLLSGVGDEGGFAPMLNSDEEAFELLTKAVNDAGYSENEIKFAVDVASSEWYDNGKYILPKRNMEMTSDSLIEYYEKLTNKYPIISIEDGLSEDDWDGWIKLTEKFSKKLQLVGDDLFVTNKARLETGIEKKAGNSILIKPNQIGTLTETLDVIRIAKENGYSTVISHRSGETEDTSIADIAVAVNAGQIKSGAPCRTDRVAKYNRLVMIERELNKILKC